MHVRLGVKLGALAVAGSTALLVLAGGPALASTKPVTGPEVISALCTARRRWRIPPSSR